MSSEKHVFLSFAGENKAFARSLAALMEERGADVYLDDHLRVGDLWSETLRLQMEKASALVLILPSEQMSNRNYIWFEAGVAKALRKRVIAVLPPLTRLAKLPSDVADILVLDTRERSLESIADMLVQAVPDYAELHS